jgi:hypothetical protein
MPFGAHHDAALSVMQQRDVGAVRPSILSLRWQADASDRVVCTRQHCVDALRTITGADVGDTYDGWRAWWANHGDDERWRTYGCR